MPKFDFNANELHGLGRLVFAAGNAALDEAPGSRRTRRVGEGTDFMDFRSYTAGDDFRKVDWNLYGRLRQLFIRLHEAPRQLSVQVLIDVSRSMNFGHRQTKMEMALRVACALSFVALRGCDRVFAHVFADSLLGSIGPLSGAAALPKIIAFLKKAPTGNNSDLLAAVRTLRARRRAKGMLIILSDFLNVTAVETAVTEAIGSGARVVAIQILDEIDRGAGLKTGMLRLRDSESGQMVDIQLDERAVALYAEKFEAHRQQLEDFCRRRGQTYGLADTRASYLQVVSQVLRGKAVLR